MKKSIATIALLAGTCLAAPALAGGPAASQREAELETRLNALEAALTTMKAELDAARGEAKASNDATNAKVATWESKLPKPEDGFKVGGTTVKINGFFKAVGSMSHYDDGTVANYTLLRDFYVPGQVPVGGTSEGRSFEGHAKQTRIWLTTATPVGGHMLKGHLEFDAQTSPGTQASQRTTNGYNFAMRRAFISYDKWLFGQEWSNFQYLGALPESTDFVGVGEGTVFVRQPQVRYTTKLNDKITASISAENSETATATPASAALAENGDDRIPDITARFNIATKIGEFSVAGLWRQLSVDTGTQGDKAIGWGISAAGKIPFGGKKQHDLRFMISKGDGVGRYIGLNLAADAVYNAATNKLETPSVTAGFAAVRFMLSPTVRTNLMASFQDIDYVNGFVPTGATKSSKSAAINLFYSPVKPLDLGIEFRVAERELVTGASGQMNRLELAARYSF